MTKTITQIALLFSFNFLFAQYNDFNRWSIEFNVGQNKAVRPFSPDYFTANPQKLFSFSGINHLDCGVRYMLTPSFGLKIDLANDSFKNIVSSGSLPFRSHQTRLGFQGVINLGRLLEFETITDRFGLLTHGGIQMSYFSTNGTHNKDISELNGGIMFGLTPQYSINKWLALSADFSVVNNVRQHLNWDGTASAYENNLTGLLYTASVGLVFYLGDEDSHADWVFSNTQGRKDYDKISLNNTSTKDLNSVEKHNSIIVKNQNDIDFVADSNKYLSDFNKNMYSYIFYKTNSLVVPLNDDEIKTLISVLNNFPNSKINLIGISPTEGGNELSIQNSLKRAELFRNAIVKHGFDPMNISAISGVLPTKELNFSQPVLKIELTK